MIIFLFSLKSYDFCSVLKAHYLLHDFLHLFIYDAAKTVGAVQQIATAAHNVTNNLKRGFATKFK
jgi:hypothetical protein